MVQLVSTGWYKGAFSFDVPIALYKVLPLAALRTILGLQNSEKISLSFILFRNFAKPKLYPGLTTLWLALKRPKTFGGCEKEIGKLCTST